MQYITLADEFMNIRVGLLYNPLTGAGRGRKWLGLYGRPGAPAAMRERERERRRRRERRCSTRAPVLSIFEHFEIRVFEVLKKCEFFSGDTYTHSEYPWQVSVEISFCFGP